MKQCALIQCLQDIFKDFESESFWPLRQLGRKWILESDEPEYKSYLSYAWSRIDIQVLWA